MNMRVAATQMLQSEAKSGKCQQAQRSNRLLHGNPHTQQRTSRRATYVWASISWISKRPASRAASVAIERGNRKFVKQWWICRQEQGAMHGGASSLQLHSTEVVDAQPEQLQF